MQKPLEVGPIEPAPKASSTWAACIKRVYQVDPLSCPRCGETMKIIAFLTDQREINKIAALLEIAEARAPD